MLFFSKLKALFNKSIAIMPHQRCDLISMAKFKKGQIKVGSEIVVDEGFNLVVVYYDKVCDVLKPGSYVANEMGIPKLYIMSKALLQKNGKAKQKTLKGDIYFVNTQPQKHVFFRTPERIIADLDGKKVKIKLEGTFTFKVEDAEKLMQVFCSDYAVVKNKRALKDIATTVGYDVSKILNSKKFSLTEYLTNQTKIAEVVENGINVFLQKFGLSASEFFVSNVLFSKKYLSEHNDTFKQSFEKEEMAKVVEERINNLQKDLDVVYVNKEGESTKVENENNFSVKEANRVINSFSESTRYEEGKVSPLQPSKKEDNIFVEDNVHSTYGYTVSEQDRISSLHQPVPDIIVGEYNGDKETSNDLPKVENDTQNSEAKKQDSQNNDKLVDDIMDAKDKYIDYFIKEQMRRRQEKENKIADILKNAKAVAGKAYSEPVISMKVATKKCSKCNSIIDEDAKFCSHCGASTTELLICPCCGAKNFPSANTCCVCKSEL